MLKKFNFIPAISLNEADLYNLIQYFFLETGKKGQHTHILVMSVTQLQVLHMKKILLHSR